MDRTNEKGSFFFLGERGDATFRISVSLPGTFSSPKVFFLFLFDLALGSIGIFSSLFRHPEYFYL